MSADPVEAAHAALLSNQGAVDRLRELRGWTRDAIEVLGLGLDGGRVVIPIHDAAGELVNIQRYQPNPARRDGAKMMAQPGRPRDLFPAPEKLPERAPVWIVEGEPDAIAATSAGLAATGIPGAGGWKEEWGPRFAGRDVIVCCDCDGAGRGLAARVAECVVEHAETLRVVDLAPAKDDGYDLGDFIAEGADDAETDVSGARELLSTVANYAPLYIAEKDRPPRPALTVLDWTRVVLEHLDRTEDDPAWPLPFTELTDITDGGIRAGELWVVAGWTSHCKSVFADQMLDTAAEAGARAGLYITEMTLVQRGLRRVSRATGISLGRLRRPSMLTDDERARARDAARGFDFPASIVSDWKPEHVATHVRASRTQVAVVDLFHGFHYRDERELSSYVNVFSRAATSDASAGAAVVLVCHLNDGQMRERATPQRPKPGMHSLKGATSIKQAADVILFTYLEDAEDGTPTTHGEVWIAKNRNGGGLGVSVPVELNTRRLRLERRLTRADAEAHGW